YPALGLAGRRGEPRRSGSDPERGRLVSGLVRLLEDHQDTSFAAKLADLERRMAETKRLVAQVEAGAGSVLTRLSETSGGLVAAAAEPTGRQWDVLLIQAGTSLNGNYYSPDTLREAAPLFDSVPCYADHGTGCGGRSVKDKVGFFSAPEFGSFDAGGRA